MKFVFRWHMQNYAEPVSRPAAGWRGLSRHVPLVSEAAERFVREQLSRKREKTLRR